ncbi:hypothetical protein [Tropicibacter naphthalenivorans]|uniref:Uncharacterized protein n=1 Tax=Tropicibacter naphthalenivorans TaxID=441103 RepID=A0A0P1G1G7_9RHOB|nr:hypothetical protein [Tropicibacter naphthalenivorans]CUH75642.1 hypothetical protein TRN7648_00542 [Tropicibacter naphthalenivorans]SMC43046.1 hypothetical protein SAMN04488093_101337 [Tropicibacter naphthalenivorans]
MKTGAIIGAIVAAVVIGFAVYMIDIDQTEEARLPDVTVEGGNMPKFDADVGDIDVDEEEVTVTVPTIDVQPPAE